MVWKSNMSELRWMYIFFGTLQKVEEFVLDCEFLLLLEIYIAGDGGVNSL